MTVQSQVYYIRGKFLYIQYKPVDYILIPTVTYCTVAVFTIYRYYTAADLLTRTNNIHSPFTVAADPPK